MWALECALRLENEIFRCFKHGKPYNDKARSLVHNLEDTKNSTARSILLSKKITPEEFLQQDIRTFASEELKTQRELAEKVKLYNSRSDWDTEKVKQQGDDYKGLFKCENCKSMKTGFI